MVLPEPITYDVILVGYSLELTSQTKVTNFNRAILENEQVGGFDVTMDHTSRMNVL